MRHPERWGAGMRRREFIAGLGAAIVWPFGMRAQEAGKVFQVGFLYPGPQAAAPSRLAAFRSGLRAGLRVEQIEIVPAVAGGDNSRLAPLAADLVRRKVDLILAAGPTAITAAQAATSSIPIIAGDLESDPVANGFITSYAQPGGNLTGTFLDFPDFGKKWLEAIREAVPQATTVAAFWDPAVGTTQHKAVEAAAAEFGVKLIFLEIRNRAEFEATMQSAVQRGAGALLMLSSPLIGGNTKMLAELCLKHRLPAMTLFTDFARDGGLMAYGPNLLTFFRQQGVMAAKVLRGAKPADIPIENPTKFEFVLNLKTASKLGLTVPATTLLRADEVIE